VTRSVEVLATGAVVLVEDDGRPGHAHLGVPRSGWLDAGAAGLANRLVGNPPGAALLECLLGGVRLRAGTAMTVAVTGAPCPVTAGGRPVPFGEPVSLAAGDELALGTPTSGLRSYVAVAGGVDVAPVLGSRSTDTLSGTGPKPVAVGDLLPVGPARGEPRPTDVGSSAASADHRLATSCAEGPVRLRLWAGPRADWFTDEALATLTSATYTVDAASDRIGLRLEGPVLARARDGELPSEGIVLGAVQVPAEGMPLVFLRDHPTTGGYPVVAVVEATDLDRCAQLRPGDRVTFRWAHPPTRAD
jgi:biotin-dependent carboxylase-like uncharacterized protein